MIRSKFSQIEGAQASIGSIEFVERFLLVPMQLDVSRGHKVSQNGVYPIRNRSNLQQFE